MYCSKCGKEIPDNSVFCGNCGTAVQKQTSTTVSKKEQKRPSVWLSLAVIAAVFLIGKLVIAPSMLSETESNQDSYHQEEQVESSSDFVSASADYSEIFSSRNIVEMPAMFMMLDSSAFASVSEDGIIEKLEFGYENDNIKEMVNTLYYPISDMDDTQKNALDAAVKENLAAYSMVDFCSVSYDIGNLYYTATVHFSELDSAENIQKMSEFGILTGNEADYLSMTETESNLLAAGYVKR